MGFQKVLGVGLKVETSGFSSLNEVTDGAKIVHMENRDPGIRKGVGFALRAVEYWSSGLLVRWNCVSGSSVERVERGTHSKWNRRIDSNRKFWIDTPIVHTCVFCSFDWRTTPRGHASQVSLVPGVLGLEIGR